MMPLMLDHGVLEVFPNLNDPKAHLDAQSGSRGCVRICLSWRFGLCRINTEI